MSILEVYLFNDVSHFRCSVPAWLWTLQSPFIHEPPGHDDVSTEISVLWLKGSAEERPERANPPQIKKHVSPLPHTTSPHVHTLYAVHVIASMTRGNWKPPLDTTSKPGSEALDDACGGMSYPDCKLPSGNELCGCFQAETLSPGLTPMLSHHIGR